MEIINSKMSDPQALASKKFYNLPINTKTNLISWFSVGSLAIIVIFGGLILRQGLKSRLIDRVKSQLAVTDIQYNIKIDQMSFVFGVNPIMLPLLKQQALIKMGNKFLPNYGVKLNLFCKMKFKLAKLNTLL
jgi:hypothetical protein